VRGRVSCFGGSAAGERRSSLSYGGPGLGPVQPASDGGKVPASEAPGRVGSAIASWALNGPTPQLPFAPPGFACGGGSGWAAATGAVAANASNPARHATLLRTTTPFLPSAANASHRRHARRRRDESNTGAPAVNRPCRSRRSRRPSASPPNPSRRRKPKLPRRSRRDLGLSPLDRRHRRARKSAATGRSPRSSVLVPHIPPTLAACLTRPSQSAVGGCRGL
jgi:hypothetical protein